jgi:hypothetical protein
MALLSHFKKKSVLYFKLEARGSVVGSGTMLQTGRSRARFPMRSMDFPIDLILPAAIMALRLTQPLRGVPGIFLGVKGDRRLRVTTLYTSCVIERL